MTGGHSFSQELNDYLSQVAEQAKIGIGVGSQRAALEDVSTRESFQIVRNNAKNTLKIGNIGVGQIVNDFTNSDLKEIVEMIDADAIAFHFNPLRRNLTEARSLRRPPLLNCPRFWGTLKTLTAFIIRSYPHTCPKLNRHS